MFRNLSIASVVIISVSLTNHASAAVTLLDRDQWRVLMNGFVQADALIDSTRSLGEVAGNSAVSRPTTANGDNGRTQFSVRNSRFGFAVVPPVSEAWSTRGVLEFDLLGPTVLNSSSANSNEASTFNNAALRVRHFYIQAESGGWQVLAGQYWSLFGWEPNYFTVTDSIPPVSGTIYERTVQVTLLRNFDASETHRVSAGVSLARPPQRDAQVPSIDAGVRWIYSGRKSGFSGASSEIKAQPMSLGVSGRLNQFEYLTTPGDTSSAAHMLGSAIAIDGMLPLIAANSDKATGNSLSLAGEFSTGRGYSEAFPGFTGNLNSYNGAAVPNTGNPVLPAGTNLDAGQIGLDPNSGIQLVQLQTWNLQLQYHLPMDSKTFVTAGYGQLYSNNIDTMTVGLATGTVPYDRSESYFINVFHEFTQQIRAGIEADQFRTTYADGAVNHNNRLQLSAFFLF
jgi:hypothetical protein